MQQHTPKVARTLGDKSLSSKVLWSLAVARPCIQLPSQQHQLKAQTFLCMVTFNTTCGCQPMCYGSCWHQTTQHPKTHPKLQAKITQHSTRGKASSSTPAINPDHTTNKHESSTPHASPTPGWQPPWWPVAKAANVRPAHTPKKTHHRVLVGTPQAGSSPTPKLMVQVTAPKQA